MKKQERYDRLLAWSTNPPADKQVAIAVKKDGRWANFLLFRSFGTALFRPSVPSFDGKARDFPSCLGLNPAKDVEKLEKAPIQGLPWRVPSEEGLLVIDYDARIAQAFGTENCAFSVGFILFEEAGKGTQFGSSLDRFLQDIQESLRAGHLAELRSPDGDVTALPSIPGEAKNPAAFILEHLTELLGHSPTHQDGRLHLSIPGWTLGPDFQSPKPGDLVEFMAALDASLPLAPAEVQGWQAFVLNHAPDELASVDTFVQRQAAKVSRARIAKSLPTSPSRATPRM